MSSVVDAGSMVGFDRFLFAYTIASHIILVTLSISLIVIISISEFLAIRRNDRYFAALARKLTRVFVVSFGVGTASGIVMAVELVTLFPGFMTLVSQTGAIALFYAEVFAFFLEILALVIYVYYADYFRGRYTHWVLSLFIMAGTIMSAVFITMVNSWMNTPNGFDIQAYIISGVVTGVNPWAPFLTASTLTQIAHVLATTLFTGSTAIGAYLAYRFIRSRDYDERKMLGRGLRIAWILGIITIILVGLTGTDSMASLIGNQPLKYAAFDGNMYPGTNLPERFFGTFSNGVFIGGILVPGMQSFLAQFEAGISMLPGLSQFPQSIWPPLIVHTTFDLMVVAGLGLGVFFLAYLLAWALRKRPSESRLALYLIMAMGIIAFFTYEIGWMSDELGRQPWIVYNVMTVSAAANTSSSVFVPGILIAAFYLVIVPATFYFFGRVFNSKTVKQELEEEPIKGGVNY